MSLTYDTECDQGGSTMGNCTSDGVYGYTYDAWNRLRKAQRSASGDTTTIATYTYLGHNRRISKVVENCGPEETANDGGNTTVRYYYGSGQSRDRQGAGRWSILETRNGSNQTTRQWVYGTQYVDEPLFMDVNGDPTDTNDCNPDVSGGESDTDRRYAYVQDRNWNVTAMLETDDGTGTAGRVVERYAYTPYGEFIVIKGDAGNGQLGNVLVTSGVGNPFTYRGMASSPEIRPHGYTQDPLDPGEGWLPPDDPASCRESYGYDCPPGEHWEGTYPFCSCVPDSTEPPAEPSPWPDPPAPEVYPWDPPMTHEQQACCDFKDDHQVHCETVDDGFASSSPVELLCYNTEQHCWGWRHCTVETFRTVHICTRVHYRIWFNIGTDECTGVTCPDTQAWRGRTSMDVAPDSDPFIEIICPDECDCGLVEITMR